MDEVDQNNKSVIRLQAEESAKKILVKMKDGDSTSTIEDLISRLEKSHLKSYVKRLHRESMKEGVKFITDNRDKVYLFKVFSEIGEYGIGIGIMNVDKNFEKFHIATCICSPKDYHLWSNKVAKGYLGNRLRDAPLVVSYDEKVFPLYIAQCISLKIMSDACLNISGPRFLRKIFAKNRYENPMRTPEFSSLSIEEICTGKKTMDRMFTGSLALDRSLGGGIPVGRTIILAGLEG